MSKQQGSSTYRDWKRKHPRFPGVQFCVERRNTQGELVEIVCKELEENAKSHANELVAAFSAESDERVRRILLGIMVKARLPEAFSEFVENLRSPDEHLRYWAIEGLRSLDTPESRKALWEAGVAPSTKRKSTV